MRLTNCLRTDSISQWLTARERSTSAPNTRLSSTCCANCLSRCRMRLLDLFSGIGGFSLGLERAGHETVAFCEIDPYCQRVLARHWPHVACYGDIRTLTAARLAADGIIAPVANASERRRGGANGRQMEQSGRTETISTGIDAICGGFPCQDISVAGK